MFGTSKSEVDRHRRICMKRTLPALAAPVAAPAYQTPAEVAITAQNVRSVTQRAQQLVDRMEQAFQECQGTGDYNILTKCAKEVREGLRLLAQLSGELGPSNQVNVAVLNAPSMQASPEWPVLMKVLDRHPEIRDELTAALQEAKL
jgi:hypothetical protein